MPSVRPYLHYLPHIAPNVYIDPSATVIGNVRLGEDSSVWCGSVIRGDVNHIHIGRRSNIQYMGSPAVAVRELTDAERAHFLYSAAHYVKLAADYLQP